MEKEQFYKVIKEDLNLIDLEIDEEKATKLYNFMNILIEENKKINLTSIVQPEDIALKHFTDSLIISKYIESNSNIIDVGTGAGFPGVPLAIYRENVNVTLLDSLNKRIEFLKKVKDVAFIENCETIWGRAEDVAKMNQYRESYDVAVSRAVAPLNVLLEYLLPFVKVEGKCVCMKGPNYKEEMKEINTALNELGGKIEKIEEVKIGNNDRAIIIVKKLKKTARQYPRKAGIPSKKPL